MSTHTHELPTVDGHPAYACECGHVTSPGEPAPTATVERCLCDPRRPTTGPFPDFPVTERRVSVRKPGSPTDPNGGWIRTTCSGCGRFIGYRPWTPEEMPPVKWLDIGVRQ